MIGPFGVGTDDVVNVVEDGLEVETEDEAETEVDDFVLIEVEVEEEVCVELVLVGTTTEVLSL